MLEPPDFDWTGRPETSGQVDWILITFVGWCLFFPICNVGDTASFLLSRTLVSHDGVKMLRNKNAH